MSTQPHEKPHGLDHEHDKEKSFRNIPLKDFPELVGEKGQNVSKLESQYQPFDCWCRWFALVCIFMFTRE